MNRTLLLLGLFAVLGVTGYAQGVRGFGALNNPSVLAGAVNPDGSIDRGSHFLVRHLATGVYRIRFDDGFAHQCPILTVTSVGIGNNPPEDEVFE
jgi:hypothetical protein